MSHHKMHMKKKGGGAAMAHRDDYAGSGEPNVVKDAMKKKRGGSVHHGKVEGHKGKHRIHKKRGGAVDGKGSDHHPFSSAYSAKTEAE